MRKILSRKSTLLILLLCKFTPVTAQVSPSAVPDWPLSNSCPVILLDENSFTRPIDMDIVAQSEISNWQGNHILNLGFQLPVNEPYRLEFTVIDPTVAFNLYIHLNTQGGLMGPITEKHLRSDHRLITDVIFDSSVTLDLQIAPDFGNSPLFNLHRVHRYSDEEQHRPEVPEIHARDREEPVIMLTGYWPPTNEMIRHFSQNPALNPEGWLGEDWQGLGYDVVSFFPEFNPPDCDNCGQGYGDLEVDYQDFSLDFWNIIEDVNPIAIITFSRGWIDYSWELEWNLVNRTNWVGDYTTPVMPTPNPPDQEHEAFLVRNSDLPLDGIIEAINDANLGLNPYVDWNGDAGRFLSEFAGYHGTWYRDINQYGEFPCYTAGHVHVGGLIDWDTAREAAEITLNEVIEHLDQFIFTPGDANDDGIINVLDLVTIVNYILGLAEPDSVQFYAADINTDGIINVLDVIVILNIIVNEG